MRLGDIRDDVPPLAEAGTEVSNSYSSGFSSSLTRAYSRKITYTNVCV